MRIDLPARLARKIGRALTIFGLVVLAGSYKAASDALANPNGCSEPTSLPPLALLLAAILIGMITEELAGKAARRKKLEENGGA